MNLNKMKTNNTIKSLLIICVLALSTTSCEKPEEPKIQEPLLRGTGTVTDIDGNTYKTIQLGDQWWMAENLSVTQYADGSPITQITEDSVWRALSNTDKAFCYYNNNKYGEGDKFGALYTWAAAVKGAGVPDSVDTMVQGVCPAGWHVPSRKEWQTLIENVQQDIGSTSTDATALKSKEGWSGYNGNDIYGFSALASGYQTYFYGTSIETKLFTFFWSSTTFSDTRAYQLDLHALQQDTHLGNEVKRNGFSVRCVKN